MPFPKILAFAGSLRVGSYNKQLVQIAADGARQAGAEVTLIDLHDYPLPVFDEDLEASGTPENALKLQKLMLEHQGLLISSAEYNSSLSAVLKNTIDWISRPIPSQPRLACFIDKVAVLMSASTGALGGMRGLVHLRAILSSINVLVLPEQISIPNAAEAFTAERQLNDAAKHSAIQGLGQKLAATITKLNN